MPFLLMKEGNGVQLKTYAAKSHAHPFLRQETDKVVWVLSFDHLRIRTNTALCHIVIPTFS